MSNLQKIALTILLLEIPLCFTALLVSHNLSEGPAKAVRETYNCTIEYEARNLQRLTLPPTRRS